MKQVILLLLLAIIEQIFAQPYFYNRSKTTLFPEHKLFVSNFSDPSEAKIGTQFYLEDKNLQLNIGAAKDLVHHRIDFKNSLAFGTEFFSWTLLHRETQFRFPVITTDYFFGGYFVFYHSGRKIDWVNRIRLSHISAHLSDGSFDKNQNLWLNNQLPFTYSREFVQWTSLFIHKNLKLYFDAIYVFHSIPELKYNTITGAGSEFVLIGFPEIITKIFTGFDLKFQKLLINKFESNKNFSAGFIIGNEWKTHFRLAYQYYNGYKIHGQFYTSKINQSFINLSLIL